MAAVHAEETKSGRATPPPVCLGAPRRPPRAAPSKGTPVFGESTGQTPPTLAFLHRRVAVVVAVVAVVGTQSLPPERREKRDAVRPESGRHSSTKPENETRTWLPRRAAAAGTGEGGRKRKTSENKKKERERESDGVGARMAPPCPNSARRNVVAPQSSHRRLQRRTISDDDDDDDDGGEKCAAAVAGVTPHPTPPRPSIGQSDCVTRIGRHVGSAQLASE